MCSYIWGYVHDDVIKWRHFPRHWSFVRWIHRSPGEFPAQRPVTPSFDVFFDLRLNERLSKQSWIWWFETLSRPLWRQCNAQVRFYASLYQWHQCVAGKLHTLNPSINLSVHVLWIATSTSCLDICWTMVTVKVILKWHVHHFILRIRQEWEMLLYPKRNSHSNHEFLMNIIHGLR